MNELRNSFLAWLASCLLLPLLLGTSQANAEMRPAAELASCQMHAIGIYSPKNHSKDDRVFVQVKPTGKPMVIVLSGYFGAQWNIKIDEGADVRQVLIPGYFEHSVVGLPDSIPVEFVTYFPTGDRSRSDYFWAYSWHSKEGRRLRSRLKELTGLDLNTFQGEYSGSKFVIDGKRGEISQYQSPPVNEDDRHQRDDRIKRLIDSGRTAKLQHQKTLEQHGKNHPIVKQMEKSLELIQAEISRLGGRRLHSADATETTRDDSAPAKGLDQSKVIEELVRQTFQLETQLQIARIEKAESDLKRVKVQLQQRQDAAEKIIADRVKFLLSQRLSNQSETNDSSSKELMEKNIQSAAELARDGWLVWREHDWPAAETTFLSSLRLDPDNESARNGLGWSLLHQGRFDEAIKQFRMVVQSNPTHGGALNGIGQAYLGQGKLDDAERELLEATEDMIAAHGDERAVRLGVTASWFGLVRTYIEKGDADQARRWINRYLKHKPDDPMMKNLLKQLESEVPSPE